MSTATLPDLMSDAQAELYVDGAIKRQTFALWRTTNKGPKFVRLGRNIRYRRADLDDWLRQNTINPAAIGAPIEA